MMDSIDSHFVFGGQSAGKPYSISGVSRMHVEGL